MPLLRVRDSIESKLLTGIEAPNNYDVPNPINIVAVVIEAPVFINSRRFITPGLSLFLF